MQKTILGLDLGTNSIGWALIERNNIINYFKKINNNGLLRTSSPHNYVQFTANYAHLLMLSMLSSNRHKVHNVGIIQKRIGALLKPYRHIESLCTTKIINFINDVHSLKTFFY